MKLKELTKYFDFKHEMDVRDLPFYAMEYINQGEKILLTGPSGCGKSTLVKMLMRYVEVDFDVINNIASIFELLFSM